MTQDDWSHEKTPTCPRCHRVDHVGRSFSKEYAPTSVSYWCRDCNRTFYWGGPFGWNLLAPTNDADRAALCFIIGIGLFFAAAPIATLIVYVFFMPTIPIR